MPKKYITINEAVRIVKEIRSTYPESVFPSPDQGGESPSAYFATGARTTCDLILARLPTASVEATVEEAEEPKKTKARAD